MFYIERGDFMNSQMKACFTPHVIVHSLTGLGIGLILVNLIPSIANMGLTLGVIILVVGIVADFYVNPAKK